MSPFLELFWKPALAAGLVAIGVTVAVERLGGRRGGLLGTLPTTIVPAVLGFWAGTEEIADFRDALYIVPLGMMLNALFLWSWRILPPRLPAWPLALRLTVMVVASLALWSGLAMVAIASTGALRAAGFSMAPVGWGFFALALGLGVLVCLRQPPAPGGSRRVGVITLLSRGVLAACAVGLAVALAALTGPLIAGVMSIFPAIFVTTMISLWWSQGEAVPAGAVGPMMLGSTSISAFALAAALTVPALGPLLGTVSAWCLSAIVVTVPAWTLLSWLGRRRVSARPR